MITSKRNDVTIVHLKKLAKINLGLQILASSVYLFCSILIPKSNVAAVVCGILAITISLSPIIYALYQKYFFVLFSCLSGFTLAPIWFLYKDSVLPGTDTYIFSPANLRIEAFFWIALFQFFVSLLYILFWRKAGRYSVKAFSFLNKLKLSSYFYFKLTIITFVFPLVAFYIFYGSIDTLWLAISGGRAGGGSGGGLLIQDSVGTSSSLMIPINSLWQLTPLFGSITFISSKNSWKLYSVLSLLLGLSVIFVFFLGGSRGYFMFVAAPVLFFLFYYNWHRGFKFWLPALMLIFGAVGIMELQVRFRGNVNLLSVLADPAKAAKSEGLSSVTTLDPTQTQQENNMYLFCLMIKGYPDKYKYEGFNDFFATIVNPIPRAIWSGKPIFNGAKDLSYQPKYILDGPLFMGTTSLTYSVVGEAYLSGGFLGIVIYAIAYAIFLFFFDGITYYTANRQVLAVGMLGISAFLGFWGYRAFFALFTFLYPLILFIFLMRMISLLQKRKLRDINS